MPLLPSERLLRGPYLSDMGSPGSSLTGTAAILAMFGFAASAQAAFPGTNGRIGYALETYPTLSDAASSYELVTILPDGTARRAVGGAASGPVAFSPDGRRIIYVDGYDLDLRIASVNERGRTRVLTKSYRGGYEESGSPDWSPSGRRIVYQRRHADGPTELWINYFKGERKLIEGTDPAWSVRGDIAFTPAGAAGGGIRVIRPDGTQQRQISQRGRSPDWSPDGKRIVFTVGSRIASMRVDGSGFRLLANGSEPCFSPDGKQIAFRRGSTVWKMTSAGRRVKRLRSHIRFEFEDFGTTVYAPDWQPRPARGAQPVTGS
jgi:Tol biopolymer transport system component